MDRQDDQSPSAAPARRDTDLQRNYRRIGIPAVAAALVAGRASARGEPQTARLPAEPAPDQG